MACARSLTAGVVRFWAAMYGLSRIGYSETEVFEILGIRAVAKAKPKAKAKGKAKPKAKPKAKAKAR